MTYLYEAIYYVYIIENISRKFHYIGLTHNLEQRISNHKNGLVPVTKSYLPVNLVWYCVFRTKNNAATFEKYLKSGSGRAFAKKYLWTC